MEIPSKVSIFSRSLELKGKPGTLIAINENGFYEIVMDFQGRNHVVLFPIAETAIIFNEAQPTAGADFVVERYPRLFSREALWSAAAQPPLLRWQVWTSPSE